MSHLRSSVRPLLVVLATLLALLAGASPAVAADPGAEARILQLLNGERTSRGLAPLASTGDLTAVARAHSDRMAAQSRLYHNPSLSTEVTGWSALAENVGYGASADQVHTALMNSTGHRANILNGTYSQIGIGVTVSAGRVWVTQAFRQPNGRAAVAAPAAPPAANPFGSLDSLRRVPGGIEVRGWTIDPDAPGARAVHVWVNGAPAAAVTADGARPDVGAAYPAAGASHGYTVVVPVREGSNTVCSYGINAGAGSNALLACRPVDVRVSPLGAVDTATPSNGGLRLRGWALDPDTAAAPVVHVWVDGKPLTAFTTGFDRPDVAAAYPGYGGQRAFDVVVPLPAGARQACAYGINVGPGSNGLLACRAIG